MSKPILYGNPNSTCTRRCLLTANEIGLELDFKVLDFSKGEHIQPAHLARQPFGKVPALQDGDFNFYESRAIVNYLVRQYGSKSGLIPTTPKELAVYDQWSSLEATVINPEIIILCYNKVWAKYYGQEGDESKVKAALVALETPMKVLDAHLAKNQYLAGDKYSALDIIFTPYTSVVFDGTEEGKAILAAHHNIAKYWKSITSRPSWQKIANAK